MELAGLSVAYGVYDYLQHKSNHNNPLQNKSVLLLCGPGNNGGDALVAARHLYHWGHIPTVYYPNMEKVIQNLHANNSSNLYANLLLQLQNLNIPILTSLPDVIDSSYYAPYDGIVDGFFGFSYDASRVMKEPYRRVLDSIIQAHRLLNVISIDIPSGWDINSHSNIRDGNMFIPGAVISLTTPKYCMVEYDMYIHEESIECNTTITTITITNSTSADSTSCSISPPPPPPPPLGVPRGIHYLGGRFLSPGIAHLYNIKVPNYNGLTDMTTDTSVQYPYQVSVYVCMYINVCAYT